jgi:hypothetical protein
MAKSSCQREGMAQWLSPLQAPGLQLLPPLSPAFCELVAKRCQQRMATHPSPQARSFNALLAPSLPPPVNFFSEQESSFKWHPKPWLHRPSPPRPAVSWVTILIWRMFSNQQQMRNMSTYTKWTVLDEELNSAVVSLFLKHCTAPETSLGVRGL